MEATTKRAAIQATVLEATETLLREGASFADLNVERIARGAGISRTAFYFYFSDKRELLMRLSEDVTNELYEQADIWWSGDGDPADDIREAITRVATLYTEHAPLLRAIVEVSTYDEEVAGFWRASSPASSTRRERRILDEQAAGNAPDDARQGGRLLAHLDGRARAATSSSSRSSRTRPTDLVEALAGIYVRTVYGRV